MTSRRRASLDFYEVLGVQQDASTEDIKKQFRKLARECHPDVAGGDPEAAEKFDQIRKAYEVLVDPRLRSVYDRRNQRPGFGSAGSWRPPGNPAGFGSGPRPNRSAYQRTNRQQAPENNIGLEDIFDDFGDFGFGGQQPPGGPKRRAPGSAAQTAPVPGRDITLQVDVPEQVADDGGTITLNYPRLRRADDGINIYRYDEIHDLKIPPGTRHGQSLRIPRMGDAGTGGGPYGDLVCDVRIVVRRARSAAPPGPEPQKVRDFKDHIEREESAPSSTPGQASSLAEDFSDPRDAPPAEKAPSPAEGGGAEILVKISVTEALLGGRVEVETPTGTVRLSVPPCTSSGSRFRIRGKGADGTDIYAVLRIVLPPSLDDESRELIERFAQLNPYDPRD